MADRKLYKKRKGFSVTAVQLDLEFDGFSFQKWGGDQACKRGDWLVNNDGDLYTVAKDYFAQNYRQVSKGEYEKIGQVWAQEAKADGKVKTLEGFTEYKAGDYVVYDRKENGDGYAIKKHRFERMYELVQQDTELSLAQQNYVDRIVQKYKGFKDSASRNKKLFYTLQALAILTAAAVPVLTSLDMAEGKSVKMLIAVLGGLSAVVSGLLGLFKFHEGWIKDRNVYLSLEAHYEQFRVSTGAYADRSTAFELFAYNCEQILMAEREQWNEEQKPKESE